MDGTFRTNMNGLYVGPFPRPDPAFIQRSTTTGTGLRDLITAMCARLAAGNRDSPGDDWARNCGPELGLAAEPYRPSPEWPMGGFAALGYNFRQIDLLR